MNNKKAVFSTLFCIFIAALFILGCNNHLLKPQQDEPRLLVKIANSTGARNATTTGEWQISAWIENQDGSESHHQNLNSASGEEASLTFDDLVIGSQINIHLELTKNDDTQTKLTGTSGWKTIKEGVNVIVIVLREISSTGEDESDSPASGENQVPDPSTPAEPPAIVNAETPTIAEINSVIEPYPTDPQPVTTTLEAVTSVTDGGTLTYQWYSNTTNSTENGTLIGGATNATYEAQVGAGETKYFYCIVTNTNNKVNGNKTASATSNIATVASILGELTDITAQYVDGAYQLVNSEINYSNIKIEQTYTAGSETQVVTVSAEEVKDQYTIELQYNNAIGNVPATVIHKTNLQITADFTIPVKYQLDVNKLTLNGSNSVEQNGSLSLTATYADTYTKYDGGSGTTYNVKNNVNIAWIGATAQSDDTWKATANTQTTGQNTATVTLTSTDGAWCVTTGGIEKSHEYTVLALGAQDNPVTTWADLVTIVGNSTPTDTIYIAGTPDSSGLYTMEATSSITISSNTTIIPTNNVTILRGSSFTDKLFNVTGTLNLGNSSNSFIITLDGQNSAVEQPLVYSSGTLNMTNSVITRNNNSNNLATPSSLFIYSGNTTLNNVSFSGNTSGLSGAADLYLYQGAQLSLAESFASTEIYFSAAMSTTAYPVIQLNQNLSLQDANKVKITVGSTTPENIQVVNKNGYTGDLNALFTIVGSDGTSYSLDETGKIVENTQSSIPENGLSWDSSTSYLTIYNEQGLKNFRDIVNGTLTSNLTVDNQTFNANTVNRTVNATLANNIAVSENEDWIPIGKDATNGYAATFDGKGYTISGISNKSNSSSYRGFFGYTQTQATIKNLTVAGEFSKAGMYSGGLIGHANGGTIQYCVNKINITTDSSGIGGIVGYVYNSAAYTTTITGCVNLAAIQGGSKVGGIVGDNGSSSQNKVVLNQCINAGTITATDSSGSASGIFAYPTVTNGNTISNSLNLGTITCSNGSGVGITDNKTSLTIQYCLSAGTISASSKYAVASSTSGTQTKNYYDSSKITQTQSQASGNTSKTTTDLKVDSAWDTSWSTTNWSFASGRYPLPNIQDNIPPTIWNNIVTKASE